jgi:uncharacterized membrane protein YhaH (DUF805 family)
MNWYITVLRRYAVFTGRARRQEYWMFTLVSLVIAFILGLIDLSLHTWVLETVYWIAVLVPSIAVTTRRLHDTDRTGWWQLIVLVCVIGGIILLIFTVLDGQRGPNRYGPSPKYPPPPTVTYG